MNTPAPLDLSMVIVTYNCKPYVLECLDSIHQMETSAASEIIVVDNASEDGTPSAVREAFPNVRIIQNKVNRYLRAAINQGIKQSRGRFVLWLNPDTRLVTPDGFSKMTAYLDSRPDVGILGAKLFDTDGTIQPDCERFPTLVWGLFYVLMIHSVFPSNPVFRAWRYAGWDRHDTREVDSVSGACMLIRRQVFETAGLFDEACRMYWEEADFCRGARQAGWKAVHFAEVHVIHHWQKGGVDSAPREALARMMDESTLYYYRKYYGRGIFWLFAALLGLRRWVSRALNGDTSH